MVFSSAHDPRPRGPLTNRLALGILIALFCAANLQLLLGQAFEQWDGEYFFAPFYSFLARVTRGGHLLLWNPLSNGGSPDFAEPQIGALSPVMLLFGLIAGPDPQAYRVCWLAIWLFGGLGMFVLARHFEAPPWGRLLAALSFVFSGFFIGHGQHLSVVHSYAFLPWIAWRLDTALLTSRRWPACEAGALWGLSALAGNPAITISTALFLGAFAFARVGGSGSVPFSLKPSTSSIRLSHLIAALACFTIVGTIVLAPTYFSFKYEGLGFTDRSAPLPREVALGENALTPSGLAALASPYLPALAEFNNFWVETDVSLKPLYFGAAPLALALCTLLLPAAPRWKWGVAAAAFLFLGFTLATALPLRGWLYDLVPPTQYFRHASMFRGYFIFGMIVLATLATVQLDRWRVEAPPRALRLRVGLGLICVGVVGLGTFAAIFLAQKKAGNAGQFAILHASIAWGGLAVIGALVAAGTSWLPRLPLLLTALTAFDMAGAHYLSSEIAFRVAVRPFLPEPKASPDNLGAERFPRSLQAMQNQNLYMQRPVLFSYAPFLNHFHEDYRTNQWLTTSAMGKDRVWFTTNAPEVSVDRATFAAVTRRTESLQDFIIVRHTREALMHPDSSTRGDAAEIAQAPAAQHIPFTVGTYRPNELTFLADCPADGWILVTDRWSRSWLATVNGVETPIEGGNFIFRLVPVHRGRNQIVMYFEPFLIPELLISSWGTLLGVGAFGFVLARRRKAARVAENLSAAPETAKLESCAVSS